MPKIGTWEPCAGWKAQQITAFSVPKGDKPTKMHLKKIPAKVFGMLAIHEAFEGDAWPDGYNICHLPTKYRLLTVTSEADAQRIAEKVLEEYGPLFEESDLDVIRAAAPPTLVSWLKDCEKVGAWTEWIPFVLLLVLTF